ncbi:MAG: 1,4-dihydroxy-6-naphthoate synthase [Bacteroidales bacterium]
MGHPIGLRVSKKSNPNIITRFGKMRLTLAYSPCPNDTYAFHAMVHNLVDCEGLSFEVSLADVEQLNKDAAKQKYDICKLSYHAFFLLSNRYSMLRVGSALGYGNGPLLVAKKGSRAFLSSAKPNFKLLQTQTIAIPGEHTTAYLLLKIAFPSLLNVESIIFSDIQNELIKEKYIAGVLIHEGRFTYEQKGLQLIADLGLEWQKKTKLPIPLGGIAVSKSLDNKIAQKIERVLKRSIEFANHNPNISNNYVSNNAQEMDKVVLDKHIEMFVNNYTLGIGKEGEEAIYKLYKETLRIYPKLVPTETLFI